MALTANRVSRNLGAIILFCIPFFGMGQKKLPNLSIEDPNIALYINSNIKLDLDTFCLKSIIFIKFTVSKDGEISDLGFTKGSPKTITNALKDAILSSNGHWIIKNKDLKTIKNKVFLLPYIIDLSLGCNIESELQNPVNKTENMAKTIKGLVSQVEGFKSNDAAYDILNFDDKNFNVLKCIILPPLRVGNMGY